MRQNRQIWISDGKPRSVNYISYREYKNAKREFRKLHRQCASNYLKKVDEDIDNSAGMDSDYFWKLINSRKNNNSNNNNNSGEMVFDGVPYRNQAQ